MSQKVTILRKLAHLLLMIQFLNMLFSKKMQKQYTIWIKKFKMCVMKSQKSETLKKISEDQLYVLLQLLITVS